MSDSPDSPPPDPRPPWTQRVHAYRHLWWIGLAVFALDQATKLAIAARLPFETYGPPTHIPVIDGFFNLVHVGNTGAAWSILSGRSPFLAFLAVITLAGIYFWRHHLDLKSPTPQLAFGLMCGGIVGNFLDRVLHGHVIDFLDFHFGSYIYPTFNIADMGICIGVALYFIHSIRHPAPPPPDPAP